jgi:hypothetical protein
MKATHVKPIYDYQTRSIYAVSSADHLFQMKENNDVWAVIEEVVKIWAASRPNEYQSYVIDLTDTKELMYDKEFGLTKERGSNLRRYLDIPDTVMKMIRIIYNNEELPMDKKFFHKWSKKFPKMTVVNKV